MGHKHIRVYAEEIRRSKTRFFHGYPSALALLADGVLSSGMDFPQPEGILLVSEPVLDWQQQRIKEAFPGARLLAHYGCAQRTISAAWCEHRQEYHVLPQYGMTEIEPETGELITTNLYNSENGFVRFRMGDAALEWSAEPCPDCGRSYLPRITELAGRLDDYLYSTEKGWIPSVVVTPALKFLREVGDIQFVQMERDEILVRYMLKNPNSEAEAAVELQTLLGKFQEIFGIEMKFSLQRVDSFERGAAGKWKWVVSRLDRWDQLRERRSSQ
jgi:phenylacetate-CoA ligase